VARLARRPTVWIPVWIATRALTVIQIAFWTAPARRLGDVVNYERWAYFLTGHHEFPGGHGWQYPQGAGLPMLLPRLLPFDYGTAFIALMLAVDLVGLVGLGRLARRSGHYTGVWVWLLGMPLIGTVALLRFDLVPTVIAIWALIAIHRRPGWFGVLVGLGTAIKLWPILLILGEWDRRRLVRAGLVALVAATILVVGMTIPFRHGTDFLSHGEGRGLQEEAVAALPWQAAQVVGAGAYRREVRFGAWEIATPAADGVAAVLPWLMFAVSAAAALWWWARERAIRRGRAGLADVSVSRDFAFATVLALVVTSPVLSPQYMVWLLGLAAVVLSDRSTILRRPVWIVLGAVALTRLVVGSPGIILVRDLALLAAALDAGLRMARAVLSAPVTARRADQGSLSAKGAAERR
jgi:Glycosyltransferase family 87